MILSLGLVVVFVYVNSVLIETLKSSTPVDDGGGSSQGSSSSLAALKVSAELAVSRERLRLQQQQLSLGPPIATLVPSLLTAREEEDEGSIVSLSEEEEDDDSGTDIYHSELPTKTPPPIATTTKKPPPPTTTTTTTKKPPHNNNNHHSSIILNLIIQLIIIHSTSHHPGPFSSYRFRHNSVFANRKIRDVVPDVSWGDVSIVTATRNLLRAALKHPHNARFLLLSETCIPVRPFPCVYRTLAEAGHRSFIQTTPTNDRYPSEMDTVPRAERVYPRHWRKGSQWWVLTRAHAELAIGETAIFKSFLRLCRRDMPTKSGGPCIADEHYFQTVLAYHKRESEVMRRSVTYTLWNDGFASPEMFGETNIKSRIREIQSCHAISDSKGTGAKKFNVAYSTDDCGHNFEGVIFDGLGGEQVDPLESDDSLNDVVLHNDNRTVAVVRRERPCYLFARKFKPEAADKILSNSYRIVGV
ncbi:glycosyltransferase BC10 [Pycnococcus provasolii]